MKHLIMGLVLFSSTAVLDWLACKWQQARTKLGKAYYSASFELIACVSILFIAESKDPFIIVCCVAGAGVGSYLAGDNKEEFHGKSEHR
jgi:lipid-A-disaccharide synthase-like uncharacterized protein